MLHYGRGVAALLVCLFHSYGLIEKYFGGMAWGNLFQAGHSGVEFFFILSGFIILHAHRQDAGRPEKIQPFLLKRAIRILPLFWLVTLPLGLLFLAAPMLGADRELMPGKLLTDMSLILAKAF
jgi:peptidoglycan/LPS O-acetylase OafA/YrhL